jgi:predicted ester cyclase
MKQVKIGVLLMALIALLSLAVFATFAQSETATPAAETELTAEEQENQAIIEAYFEAQNSGDLEEAFAFLSPDIVSWSAVDETEPLTYEAIEGFFVGLQEAVPDLEVTVLDLITEGDRVAVRFGLTGTLAVEMMGQPAGSDFIQGIITIYRLEAGKIIEVWSY